MYQVKEGRFSLDDEISVQPSDQHLGSGMISKLDAPGVELTVLNMAHFMMMISDNSATDILLEKVGAANVNARLRALGIEGLTVEPELPEADRRSPGPLSGSRDPRGDAGGHRQVQRRPAGPGHAPGHERPAREDL